MAINKFDFSCVGWNGDLDSICGLFSDLIDNQINPATSKAKLQIQLDDFLETSDILKNGSTPNLIIEKPPYLKVIKKIIKILITKTFLP